MLRWDSDPGIFDRDLPRISRQAKLEQDRFVGPVPATIVYGVGHQISHDLPNFSPITADNLQIRINPQIEMYAGLLRHGMEGGFNFTGEDRDVDFLDLNRGGSWTQQGRNHSD